MVTIKFLLNYFSSLFFIRDLFVNYSWLTLIPKLNFCIFSFYSTSSELANDLAVLEVYRDFFLSVEFKSY